MSGHGYSVSIAKLSDYSEKIEALSAQLSAPMVIAFIYRRIKFNFFIKHLNNEFFMLSGSRARGCRNSQRVTPKRNWSETKNNVGEFYFYFLR